MHFIESFVISSNAGQATPILKFDAGQAEAEYAVSKTFSVHGWTQLHFSCK